MGVRMRKRMVCAVAMLATSGGVSLGQSEGQRSGQSGVPSTAPLTVVRAGTLIDGGSEAPRKNQLIFVRGERIEKVADGSAAIPAGAEGSDLLSAPVLPGGSRSHTAIFLWCRGTAK